MDYKLFKEPASTFNREELIEEWLKENPSVQIVYVEVSKDGDFVNMTVLYEK
ncbi:MAG: hypothetical protein JW891_04870 [Candidatus Lokiarchaeota archaeon]|nr:hypothetical protein [Candidatus Lokiarchaeota archaeon]